MAARVGKQWQARRFLRGNCLNRTFPLQREDGEEGEAAGVADNDIAF
jgi:hypothetical protein